MTTTTTTTLTGTPKQIAWAEDIRRATIERLTTAAELATSDAHRLLCVGANATEAEVAEWRATYTAVRDGILAAISEVEGIADAKTWINGRDSVSRLLRATSMDPAARRDVALDVQSLLGMHRQS